MMDLPYRQDNLIGMPLDHYLGQLAQADPEEISRRLGIPQEAGTFTLQILNETKTITLPDFADEGWQDRWRILFARYLLEGKKVLPSERFVSYSELPWGEVYQEKFRQRCILRMAGTFGNRIEAFRELAQKLGAVPTEGSGCRYEFTFLPDLKLQFILWEGDEEFPASAQILFTDNFQEAFSAEDRVVICEYILGKMR